jgi:L-lactate permease
MPKLLQRMTIGAKLPGIIGALVALTILVMSLANAAMTSMIISTAAAEKLESISVLNSKRIRSLLDAIDRDIRLQSTAVPVKLKQTTHPFSLTLLPMNPAISPLRPSLRARFSTNRENSLASSHIRCQSRN